MASATCTTDIWLTSGLEPRHRTKPVRARSGTGCTSEAPYIAVATWNFVLTSIECDANRRGDPRASRNAVDIRVPAIEKKVGLP